MFSPISTEKFSFPNTVDLIRSVSNEVFSSKRVKANLGNNSVSTDFTCWPIIGRSMLTSNPSTEVLSLISFEPCLFRVSETLPRVCMTKMGSRCQADLEKVTAISSPWHSYTLGSYAVLAKANEFNNPKRMPAKATFFIFYSEHARVANRGYRHVLGGVALLFGFGKN